MPIRCDWVNDNRDYQKYHDTEWGMPVYDDRTFFEFLILEGAQAGLSWETILKRRKAYNNAFKSFNASLVAKMTDEELEKLLSKDSPIIKNRLKVYAARKNAQVFIEIQNEYGGFTNYVWRFVGGKPIINHWNSVGQIPAHTPQSDALSKDLKKRGMSFVGTTIIYAFMQATGLVNDHTINCHFRNGK